MHETIERMMDVVAKGDDTQIGPLLAEGGLGSLKTLIF